MVPINDKIEKLVSPSPSCVPSIFCKHSEPSTTKTMTKTAPTIDKIND